jgi:UDP-N-acetylglucosamine 2-epimerase (non-hydrolysing)
MAPLRLVAIIGTRPEAIKLMPVVLAARERAEQFEVRIARTGQHREVVDTMMDEFGLRADVDLAVMKADQDLAHVLAESVRGLSSYLGRERADWVLVQGDTTSTFAGALAGFYNRVRVGHVEAGLRTGDRHNPFPEEANRALTARLADLHFAPTAQARANLRGEGIADNAIVVTGNTVVDALHRMRRSASTPSSDPAASSGRRAAGSRYFLVTTHRRENHGEPLERICDGLLAILARHLDVSAWVPMHPHPVVGATLRRRLGANARIRLTPALGYRDFVAALDGASFVLTDSGGVQEECAALGKPVLVMRSLTERAEAIDVGVALLVGSDPERIADAASALLDDPRRHAAMARPSNVFGDGRASERILDALLQAPAR